MKRKERGKSTNLAVNDFHKAHLEEVKHLRTK